MSATNVDTICPLSPLQHGMLHASRRERGSGLYVEQFSCALAGALDAEAFRAAWQAVANRHDVLKTLFLRLDTEKPVQVVRRSVTLPFVVEDWREGSADLAAGDEAARFAVLLADDRRAGFDPGVAPLMRVRLVRTGAERHRFLWTYHHAILDGWSMPVLLREVFDHLAEPARALAAPRTDYRHYLAWLARQDFERPLAAWRERLAGFLAPVGFAPSLVPAPVLAPARPDAAAGRRLATQRTELASAWVDAATARCRAARITLNTLCQAAWALLLGHYGDTDDIVHGVVVSGRSADVPGIERMAGLFIATLPVRTRLDPDASAADWLRALQSDVQEIERHAATPLARVLACAEVPRTQALFDTLYVFENYPGQSAFHELVARRGLRVEDVRAIEETGYGLALVALPSDGLKLQLTYDVAKFTEAGIAELLESYRRLLDRLLAIGDAALGTVFAGLAEAAPAAGVPAQEPASSTPEPPVAITPHAPHSAHAPLLAQDGRALDRAAFARAVDRAQARWTRMGVHAGEGVLLVGGGDAVLELAALVAAVRGGLHVVVAEPRASVAEAQAAAAEALGRAAPWRTVVVRAWDATPSPASSPADVEPCECFVAADAFEDGEGPSGIPDDPFHAPGATDAGTLTWIVRAPQGEPLGASHAWPDLVAEGRCAAGGARIARIALMAGGTTPRALHALLRAWFAGDALTLLPAAPTGRELVACLHALAAAPAPWDEVHLDGVATRALAAAARRLDAPGAAQPRVATARWSVDAAALTPRGAQALARLAPGAPLRRVLDDGLAGLPVADVAEDGTLAADHDPRRLTVVGAGGEAIATSALGRLALRGRAVPAAVWRRGRPDATRRLVTRDGPWLRTGFVAWMQGPAPAARLPAPDAVAGGDPATIVALERDLAALAGVREIAAMQALSEEREWVLRIAVVPVDPSAAEVLVERARGIAEAFELGTPCVEAVARLPRAADGRIDRRALRRGDVERLPGLAHTAPRDETEAALHAIWCALLKRERIGIDEDYFDLGGDSLLATVMLAQVEAATGRLLEIDALLRAPTLAGLARALRGDGGSGDDLAATLARDAAGPLDIDVTPTAAAAPAARHAPREIFLTGATGFLGVHLLAELLAATDARVHCLVRAGDEAAGHARLVGALQAHGLWQPAQAGRLVAVPGDLGPARFGLDEPAFDALARRVDMIFHNGAAVNFVLPYAKLKAVNVDATDEVLRLAARHAAKPVHYVSTVGVLDRAAGELPELLAVPLHARLMGGYEQSKWVAEQRVCAAAARGLPVTIHRPSRIVGHSRTGRVNVDDLFCRLIRGVVSQGVAPYGTGYDNALPVDLVARLVVEAALDPASAGRAIHVVNPRAHAFDALVDFIAARGHAIERRPYGEWLAVVATAAQEDAAHPLAPLLPVLRLLDPAKDASLARPLPLAHANLARLAPAAFAAIGTVESWLPPMFDHLEATGVLPAPPSGGCAPASRSPDRGHRAA
jgi:thioester reductase-like protein